MRNKILILFVFSLLCSCRNYESEKYIAKENEAINDIIPLLIKNDEIVKGNDFDTNNLKIFLISSLTAEIYNIYEPKARSEEEIVLWYETEEERTFYKERYKKFEKEQKLFAPLINGVLKERILDYKFEYSNLKVELISDTIYFFTELKQNEYGRLAISRIIFNRSFDKGYLAYGFYCGEGCYWSNNIEIVKINGKWKISETFSGGIS